ncbi:hypothetical protein BDN72DRAFT_776839 [Pluteus cervinus]|uniref:Uncharacterized protein n=1 Tax=Pluteus cervinus TaxID=181527 RepID=A0ACD3AAI5_9AGAR|nr:hypothetical protein BDN72DRAFT_776839 [Pluteus cervinus]
MFLWIGSYKRLVGLYTFVPLTAFLFFLLLAWLPTYAYPNKTLPTYPYSVALPFPLPELLTSVAAWSLAHHLREPLYSLGLFISLPFSSEALSSVFPVIFSTTIHAIVSITLRLLILIVLMIPHYLVFGHPTWEDPSFDRVWWVALGWAAAESIVAIKQGYEAIGLYRDVMIPLPSKDLEDLEGSVRELSQRPKAYGATESWVRAVSSARREESSPVNIAGASATSPPPPPFHHSRLAPLDIGATATERDSLLLPSRLVGGRPGAPAGADLDLRSENAIEVLVDRDLEQLNLIKAREELEDVYGIPFIRIPVFISCLQRVNTFLMSLGIFLLLSSAYIRSTIAYTNDPRPAIPSSLLNTLDNPHSTLIITTPHGELIRSNTYLFITLPTLFIIHIIFEIMHTPLVLPKLMVHTAVYIGLLVSLGVFFVGLGMWEALA